MQLIIALSVLIIMDATAIMIHSSGSNYSGSDKFLADLNQSAVYQHQTSSVLQGSTRTDSLDFGTSNLNSLVRKIRSNFPISRYKVGNWRNVDDQKLMTDVSRRNRGSKAVHTRYKNLKKDVKFMSDQPYFSEKNYQNIQYSSYDFYDPPELPNDGFRLNSMNSDFLDYAPLDSSRKKGIDRKVEWVEEPPRKAIFSNSTGGSLSCMVKGPPPPYRVLWSHADGNTFNNIPGLVHASSNGTLVFSPFPPGRYDSSVHDASYMCRVITSWGTMISLPTHVHAQMLTPLDPLVHDSRILSGNSAVLECSVGSYVKQFVSVTAWVRDGVYNIFPTENQNAKYQMTSSGNLRISNVGHSDSKSVFQCRVINTLTGETKFSNEARIIVSKPVHTQAPRVLGSQPSKIVTEEGSTLTLYCDVEAYPKPTYRWYKNNSPIRNEQHRLIMSDDSLVMSSLKPSDVGEYKCLANNSAGQISTVTNVVIKVPLLVTVTPSSVEVDSGDPLQLSCDVTGFPASTLSWYKDGNLIRSEDIHILSQSSMSFTDELKISSIHGRDAGVYQCRVLSPEGAAQGHALVKLGASPPVLTYRFIAHTLQAGPAVSLKCIARGSPTPVIRWSLDGFKLPQSHRFLIGQYVSSHGDVVSHVNITSVRIVDGGLYECRASNTAGEAFHNARLNVYGPPTVRPIPPQAAVAGEIFSIYCPVGGYPIEKVIWKKDEMQLPLSQQQVVGADGRLSLYEVSRPADEGTYSCTAESRQGISDEQSFSLAVSVPPRLAPIFFAKGTTEGMRAQATCLVQEGDTPITVNWLKDEEQLMSSSAFHISQINDFTSILVIEHAETVHSGNYTCAATNAARTTYSSAVLSVSVPPSWYFEPSDTSVSLGSNVEILCAAAGSPSPKVTWRKQTDSGSWIAVGTDPSIKSVSDYTQYSTNKRKYSTNEVSNTTLTLLRAERQHEGRYLCEAKNGVGSSISKLIKLIINESPWFPENSRDYEIEVGGKGILVCIANGDPPLSLMWMRAGQPVTLNQRYSMNKVKSPIGREILELIINDARPVDSGDYECEANNQHGKKMQTFKLLVQDVPESPRDLTLLESESRSLTISWQDTHSAEIKSSSQVTAYTVIYKAASELPNEVKVDAPLARLERLTPATSYSIYVTAVNKVGPSVPSAILRASTLEEEPSGYPRNIKIEAVTSSSVKLSWLPPATNVSHGQILGYQLGYADNRFIQETQSRKYNFTSVVLSPNGGLVSEDSYLSHSSERVVSASLNSVLIDGRVEVTLKGLNANTRYAMLVKAFNAKGAGPVSPAVTVTTNEDKPSAPPTAITCEGVTSSTLVVTWSPPPEKERNGVITTYRVAYRKIFDMYNVASQISLSEKSNQNSYHVMGGEPLFLNGIGGNMASVSDGGVLIVAEGHLARLVSLDAFTNYSVVVSASTGAGVGVQSEAVVCRTMEDTPSAPLSVKGVPSAPDSVMVAWKAPENPRGPIIKYTVRWRELGGSFSIDSHSKDYDNTHNKIINGGKSYHEIRELSSNLVEIWVTAHTLAGEGANSKRVIVKKSDIIAAGIYSIGGNVTVAQHKDLKLLCESVGEPQPTVSWTRNGHQLKLDNHITVLPSGTLRISDIKQRYDGKYSCTASNSQGQDSISYQVTVLVPPSSPTLHVTETTSSSVTLQWGMPKREILPLTKVSVSFSRDGNPFTYLVSGRTHKVVDLICGSRYRFTALAYNSIGSSSPSLPVEIRTKGSSPVAPSQFQFLTHNSTHVTLYLSQWQTGGCIITHFIAQYKEKTQDHWTTASSSIPPIRTYTIGGLQASHSYTIKVTAFNSAGETEAFYSIRTTVASDVGMVASVGTNYHLTPNDAPLDHWSDSKVLLPIVLSISALVMIVSAACVCLYSRDKFSSVPFPPLPCTDKAKESPNDSKKSEYEHNAQDLYGMSYESRQMRSDGSSDYNNSSQIYHYVSATLPMEDLVPPSPAPEDERQRANRHSKYRESVNFQDYQQIASHKSQLGRYPPNLLPPVDQRGLHPNGHHPNGHHPHGQDLYSPRDEGDMNTITYGTNHENGQVNANNYSREDLYSGSSSSIAATRGQHLPYSHFVPFDAYKAEKPNRKIEKKSRKSSKSTSKLVPFATSSDSCFQPITSRDNKHTRQASFDAQQNKDSKEANYVENYGESRKPVTLNRKRNLD